MAPRSKKLILSGWGRYPTAPALAFRPERQREVAACLSDPVGGLIPRGGGRSYGDQALNTDGSVLLTERLDRLISFDETTGQLVTEPGVTFATLIEVFLPRGWVAPVSPGTSYATLGGALANDVHGKNHDHDGGFGDHVLWFDLMLPTGEIRRVDAETEPRLFRATIGGCGLTGVILRLALSLRKVPSNAVDMRETRVPDLDAFLARLAESRVSARHSVGWIDALATGRSLGRGVVETADHAAEGIDQRPKRGRTVPVDFPSFALNKLSIRAFNELYFRRIPAEGRQSRVRFDRFLYPLDALAKWNRIYGKRGFQQFQCVLPDETAPSGLRSLLEEISKAGAASFLAVLKTLGGPGKGMLSFPLRGFTLALDFPRRPSSDALLGTLERITLDHGGRIYLAKDSALSAAGMARMYPDLPEFRTVLNEIDPDGRFVSDMARRLNLRGGVS